MCIFHPIAQYRMGIERELVDVPEPINVSIRIKVVHRLLLPNFISKLHEVPDICK